MEQRIRASLVQSEPSPALDGQQNARPVAHRCARRAGPLPANRSACRGRLLGPGQSRARCHDRHLPLPGFGLHIFVLGCLVYKSGYFPRILGVLLVFASLGYLLQSLGNFLLPKYEEIFAQVVLLTIIPELLFAFWLLFK